MSDSTTIARPYARAIFEHALAEKKLALWDRALLILAETLLRADVEDFITNPRSTSDNRCSFLQAIVQAQLGEELDLIPLLTLLAVNKRLMILPEIKVLFNLLRAEQEKTLAVDVLSFAQLSKTQENQLIESLSQRLQRKVELHIHIDTTLLGGAIIQAGDFVIDGSVRGQLNKLSVDLVA